jgi:hypothetical protein
VSIKLHLSVDPPLEQVALPFRRFRGESLDKQLEALSVVIHHKIVDEAPERRGHLKKAIVRKKRGQFNYEILVDRRMQGGKYEHYVRLGTAPHIIVPVKRRALFWPGAAHPVKIVRHPGTKANPYFDRGIERAGADIDRAEELIGSQIEKELIDK